MIVEPTKINPLNVILDIIPTEEQVLTIGMLTGLNLALIVGGIKCEEHTEIIDCLHILKEMELISLVEEGNNIKVKRLING